VLVHNGKIYGNVLRRSQLTRNELDAAIRSAGCTGVAEVHVAILENSGSITVLPRPHPS
jgi:uncharacterized membrane protein YcaP (DUF421 family)